MATPSFTSFEDITTFDVVWMRVSNDQDEGQKAPGELENDGVFTIKRASPPASSSTTQISSTSPIPMIATFIWDQFEAKFTCKYNRTSHSYEDFNMVDGSMSEAFETAFYSADATNCNKQPDLEELEVGWLKLEMFTLLSDLNPCYVELWAKARVDGMEAHATNNDLRELGLGEYASIDEEEDEGGEEDQQTDDSEDESDIEGEDEE